MGLTEWAGVLGNIGEFVSAIAVVVTLVYLTVQVRQNSSLLESNTRLLEQNHELAIAHAFSQSSAQGDPVLVVAQSDGLSEIVHKGLADFRGLDSESAMRFSMAVGSIVGAVAASMAEQRQLDLGDDGYASPQTDFVMRFIHTVGGQQWWDLSKGMYPHWFSELIDEELARRS